MALKQIANSYKISLFDEFKIIPEIVNDLESWKSIAIVLREKKK
jgi:hypothetical protein